MDQDSCATCEYFRADQGRQPVGIIERGGVCKRFPPMVVPDELNARFPRVNTAMWCGEFSLATIRGK